MSGHQDFKARISAIFDYVSPLYDQSAPRMFSAFGARLASYAGLLPGWRILDVGCGRGAALFPACAAVGAAGEVIGVDFSGEMVRETAREAASRGIRNARVIRMDAEDLHFPESSFDAVLCGLSLPFFPLPGEVLQAIRGLLRQGGVLAVSTLKTHSGMAVLDALHERFQGTLLPAPQAPTAPFAHEEELQDAFARAGFVDIESTCQEWAFRFENAEAWWAMLNSHGYRAYAEQLPPAVLPQYRSEALSRAAAELQTAEGVCDSWQILFAKGRNRGQTAGPEAAPAN